MRVHGAGCESLTEAEEDAVEAFSDIYPALCERIGGLTLYVWATSDGTWVDSYGRKVAGLTWCDLSTIELGTDDVSTGAYFHEMAHVAQCPEQDGSHSTWEALGLWVKIDTLRAKYFQQSLPDDLRDADSP